MKYNIGDKVKVLKTSYTGVIDIGEIKEVKSLIHDGSGVKLEGKYASSTDGYWAFFNSEVEPYKEEVMNDKIEVGDTVEVVDRTIYTSEVKVGDHATVLEVRDGDYKLKFPQYFYNDKPITQISNGKKDVKLVSKAKQNMKEVIGYKLVKTEYQKVVNKLSDGIVHVTTLNTFGNAKSIQNMKDAGVLDLWFEPVYKSSEVVVKLSKSRTATITSKTEGVIRFSDGSLSPFLLAKDVTSAFTKLASLGQIAGYNVGIKEFNLGCQTFTIDDLIAVNQAFVDFK